MPARAVDQTYTDQQRELAGFVAAGLRFRQEREDAKGGTSTRALDFASAGFLNSQAYLDIAGARQRGNLVTVDDLRELRITTRSGEVMRTEPTLRESLQVDVQPVISVALLIFAGLIAFSRSTLANRDPTSRNRSIGAWNEGAKLGAALALWLVVANIASPSPFADRLADSLGAFILTIVAAFGIGTVSGTITTLLPVRDSQLPSLLRVSAAIALSFAQLGALSLIATGLA